MKKLHILIILVLLVTMAARGASRTVSGQVIYSGDGSPLIGATVQPVGGGHGVATDIDGKFTLTIPTTVKEITVSYIGMATQQVPVKADMRVVMENTETALEEV